MWIAVLVVVALAVRAAVVYQHQLGSLDSLLGKKVVVVRSTGKRHVLDRMKLQIDLPPGWTYLAITDDNIATSPMFLHQTDQVILRLRRILSQRSSDVMNPDGSFPDEGETVRSIDATELLNWIEPKTEFAMTVTVADQSPHRLLWHSTPAKRTARWSGEAGDLLVEVIDLRRRAGTPPCVRRLLDGIRRTD